MVILKMNLLRWSGRIMKISNVKNMSSVCEIISTKPVGTTKTVKGWVKACRKMKEYVFIDVSDGSCSTNLQVMSPKVSCPWPLTWGTSVDITGKVSINPNGQVELLADKITVVGKSNYQDGHPFTPKQRQAYDHYREHLHLRPKVEYFTSLFRFRSAATQKIHQHFRDNKFIGIHTPIISSNDCEGAGEIFTVQANSQELLEKMKKESVTKENSFFDGPAFLTVSGQLHLETAVRSFRRVYTFNPCFRAEGSSSRFHLSEFYMIEAEESFITDIKSVLERIETCLKDVMAYLVSENHGDMMYILKHGETNISQHMEMLDKIINSPFTIMTFSEAKSLIKKNREKIIRATKENSNSLTREEEGFLVSHNNNMPVFVIDWPKHGKPFYMKECSNNQELVNGVDLLVPNVGELCGGSLREDNYVLLKKKLSDLGLHDKLMWYLDLRKYGNVPTGGFGMGFERFLQFMLNVNNIKDTIPFPRWPHNLQL